jgi:predicted PurR-regulated permease PerM
MADQPSEARKFQRAFLLLFVIAISLLFFAMVRPFLIAVLLAGIFAGLFHPTFERVARGLRGHNSWAAVLTVLLFLSRSASSSASWVRRRWR